VQYKPNTGPKFTWSVTLAAAHSKGPVVGNAERFPAAGRRRGNPVEGPSGTGCLWTRRAGQPFRVAESISQSTGFPCPSNRTGNRVTRSSFRPCDARGFWKPGTAFQASHNTPLRGHAALENKAYFVIRCNTFLNYPLKTKEGDRSTTDPKGTAEGGGKLGPLADIVQRNKKILIFQYLVTRAVVVQLNFKFRFSVAVSNKSFKQGRLNGNR
jgi:hypothetical protein